MNERSVGNRFADRICEYRRYWTSLFVLAFVLFVLLSPSLLLQPADLGSDSFVVAVIDATILLVVMVGSGGLVHYCNRKDD